MWSQGSAGADPIGLHRPYRSLHTALSVMGSYLRVLNRGVMQSSVYFRKIPLAIVC